MVQGWAEMWMEPWVDGELPDRTQVASVVFASLQHHQLWPARLLYPWAFSSKNTGVGCYALLQRIFLTQGLNLSLLRLLHGR